MVDTREKMNEIDITVLLKLSVTLLHLTVITLAKNAISLTSHTTTIMPIRTRSNKLTFPWLLKTAKQ